jgi:hypothetical protein
MQGKVLGVDYDLLITMIGLLVAGMAAIIGIWVERDPKRPPRYAIWLSALIALATGVSMFQTYDDDQDQKKVEADLARVLQQMDKIASTSTVDIPELNDLLKTELAAQSRANPDVVRGFAQRVADEGGDPAEVVAAYLPESEVQGMQRKGTFTVKPAKPTTAAAVATAEAAQANNASADAAPGKAYSRRRKLTFGGGAPILREGGETAEIKPTQKIDEKKGAPAEPAPSATADATAAAEAGAAPDADERAKLSLGGLKGLQKDGAAGPSLRPAGVKLGAPTPMAGAPKPPAPTPTQPAGGGSAPKLGGLKGLKH